MSAIDAVRAREAAKLQRLPAAPEPTAASVPKPRRRKAEPPDAGFEGATPEEIGRAQLDALERGDEWAS